MIFRCYKDIWRALYGEKQEEEILHRYKERSLRMTGVVSSPKSHPLSSPKSFIGDKVTCHPQLDWGSSVYFLFLYFYQLEQVIYSFFLYKKKKYFLDSRFRGNDLKMIFRCYKDIWRALYGEKQEEETLHRYKERSQVDRGGVIPEITPAVIPEIFYRG
jgi:hypothetical protein